MSAGLLAPVTLIRTAKGRAAILALAAITMAVEMGSLLAGAAVHVGSLPLSASLVPSLVLLVALGVPASGRPADPDRLVPFWIAMAAGLGLGFTLFSRTGDAVDMVGLIVAAANEEVVFRFAVPLVVTSALMVVRFPSRAARVVGYVVGGTWWVLLPGHQAQTDGAASLVTYIAFAVISALVVSRSRALIPMSVAHCVLNVITIAALRGDISSVGRSALSVCLLFLLVGTFAWPGDRAARRAAAAPDGSDEDLITDTVIDLRDGHRPTVQRGEEITWIAEPDRDPSASEPSEHQPSGVASPGRDPDPR
ncbi:hypothetical protein PO878_00815 [Iamia majanohamensis]|uniref:CAAX prenyl protease 2/Lysostaphin resistance protein A-like domain-containing protein n=1 Tax=Iamia majanohamensis TaxID=467976 RepID=A0AAE9YES8_9ACTN|nr:hypothetical protein [Iamia majanohamensis]WCO67262.1 hypothetical protein PO878_00815 [Iamia majanohamensis]